MDEGEPPLLGAESQGPLREQEPLGDGVKPEHLHPPLCDAEANAQFVPSSQKPLQPSLAEAVDSDRSRLPGIFEIDSLELLAEEDPSNPV